MLAVAEETRLRGALELSTPLTRKRGVFRETGRGMLIVLLPRLWLLARDQTVLLVNPPSREYCMRAEALEPGSADVDPLEVMDSVRLEGVALREGNPR